MTASLAERLADLTPDEKAEVLAACTDEEAAALLADWEFWSRPEQRTPEGAWTIWAYVGGRGAGKTRTGEEFVLDRSETFAEHGGGVTHHVATVGRTAGDVRDVCIEGESGLAACAERRGHRFKYEPSKRRWSLPDLNTVGSTFSAEEPDSLRGPQFHTAHADEPGAWTHKVDAQGNTAWTNLLFTLRLDPPPATGLIPQVIATTTPKPTPLIVDWFRRAGLAPDEHGDYRPVPDPAIVIRQASLYDNLTNLSPAFVSMIAETYAGTRLGAQEIDGLLLSSVEGALWQPEDIDHVGTPPSLGKIVVGVDPPGSTRAECGIIVAGSASVATASDVREAISGVRATDQRHGYVLDDASIRGRTEEWASAAVAAFRRWHAHAIVAEVNYGGDMVRAAIHALDPTIPVTMVRATRGKRLRAEPVALLYQRGRVHHAGQFGLLESQMLTWVEGDASPDRLDALVWAMSHLLPTLGRKPARSKSTAAVRVPTGAASQARTR